MRWLWTLLQCIKAIVLKWVVRPYATCFVEESLPKKLRRRTIYIVQEDGFQEHASMLCPCNCGQVLHMNLIPDERPCWAVSQHRNGSVSLRPSVWRKKGCKSHFWFRRGKVFWV